MRHEGLKQKGQLYCPKDVRYQAQECHKESWEAPEAVEII